jgi:cytochrome c553
MSQRDRSNKMSDAEQNLEVEVKPETTPDYKALYEKTLQDLDTVVAKKDQLYKETKAAKAAREEAAAEAQRVMEETAKKNGEFEKLWKSASQEKEELMQQLKAIKNGNRQEKLNLASMRIATELADGDNADLLSEFIKKNLENIAQDDGSLSDDILQAVASEFKNNAKFKSLLRGSKASGGGAPGNMKGASEKISLTRAEFDKMNPIKQSEFIAKVRTGSAELKD